VTDEGDHIAWADERIAELERWQKVDLENCKRHLADFNDILRGLTDTIAPELWNDAATPSTTAHKLQDAAAVLVEMLTAATDTAVQRGKTIDELEAEVTGAAEDYRKLSEAVAAVYKRLKWFEATYGG
jgi:hypothetical protein